MDDPERMIVILLIAGESHHGFGIIAFYLAAFIVVGVGPIIVTFLDRKL